MPSSNTTVVQGSPWRYYLRAKGTNRKIGLVDKDGDAITTDDLNLKIYFNSIPQDEVNDDDQMLEIHREFEFPFLKGCAYEALLVYGITNREYKREFDRAVSQASHRVIQMTKSPMMVKPINIVPIRGKRRQSASDTT